MKVGELFKFSLFLSAPDNPPVVLSAVNEPSVSQPYGRYRYCNPFPHWCQALTLVLPPEAKTQTFNFYFKQGLGLNTWRNKSSQQQKQSWSSGIDKERVL